MNTPTPEVLEKVVPPWVSAGILEEGYYHVGGYVARAIDVAGLSPSQLVEAWALRYDGSPFPSDPDHIDVLRFPPHPLMALGTPPPAPAAPRPWPMYPTGFLFGPALAPVWTLERTRVPIGAELWRRSTSGEQLLATFDGPAMGWRGSRGYYPPVHFVGTRAKWNELDLPAEILRDRTVELVSVGPDAPAGWDQVRPQVWRRVVPRSEVSELFELVLSCRYRDVECRILQHTPQQSRLLLLDDDPSVAQSLGAQEADIGSFELTVATSELSGTGGTTRTLANDEPAPTEGRAVDPSGALNALVQSLLADPGLADVDWHSFALLATVTHESSDITVYRYAADAPPRPTPLRDPKHQLLRDLHEATAAPDGTRWRVVIVKFDRATGKGDVDFAYGDDAEQWRITPDSLPRIAERLRL